MNRLFARRRDQRGAILVFAAIALTALLATVALVLDLGNGRQRQRAAQAAADASALGGTFDLLPGVADPPDPQGVAEAILAEHGFDPTGAVTYPYQTDVFPAGGDIEPPDPEDCVQVIPQDTVDTAFAQVLGVDELDVNARAVACLIAERISLYAIFGIAENCGPTEVNLSGSDISITGGVHSNGDVAATGSTPVVDGQVTYVDGATAPQLDPPPTNIPGPIPDPVATQLGVTLDDYRVGGARAVLATAYQTGVAVAGDVYFNPLLVGDPAGTTIDEGYLAGLDPPLFDQATKTIAPGLYFTEGDIDFGPGFTSVGATFVAGNGEIDFNGTNQSMTEPWDADSILAFSGKRLPAAGPSCNASAIDISAASSLFDGILYAPNGLISTSAAATSTSISGSIVGYRVQLSGAGITVSNENSPEILVEDLRLVE